MVRMLRCMPLVGYQPAQSTARVCCSYIRPAGGMAERRRTKRVMRRACRWAMHQQRQSQQGSCRRPRPVISHQHVSPCVGRACSKSQRLIVLLLMASARHTTQERRQTHEAATSAAEEGARLALKAAEHAAKLRQDALKEREELKKKNQLTFSQKVGAALTDGVWHPKQAVHVELQCL